ncbi:unnamed protein product [Schistocephalus solidus]|uniref:Calcineurin B homologous protein 1 n=1 Tax=Schistocephalus solidus TaxID=70667 RepID=A0A183T9J2_SCHSO|nr:unnamed protein product [Schistocephalus solidus]
MPNLAGASRELFRRQDFLLIPELAINPLGDRIINEFFKGGEELNFREYMRKLARFRKPTSNSQTEYNSREAKLQFLFGMYDLDTDQKISRSELLSVLQMMVGANVTMDQINRIGERTMAEADINCDGFITYEEFKTVSIAFSHFNDSVVNVGGEALLNYDSSRLVKPP